MKKFEIILMLPVIFLLACGSGGSSSNGAITTAMEDIAKETTPALTEAAITSLVFTTDQESSDKETIYDTLMSYDPALDAPPNEVGITNVYKLLYQTDQYISQYSSNCQTEVNSAIVIPFYGESTATYQCTNVLTATHNGETQNKSCAWKVNGSVMNYVTVYDHPDANSGAGDEAVVYGTYDSSTGEVELNMAGFWSNEGVNTRITGNATTHEFTFARADGSSGQRFVGAGISQGSGNHFLFKFEGTPNRYYCYNAATQVSTTVGTCNASSCGNCTSHYNSLPSFLGSSPTEHFSHELNPVE